MIHRTAIVETESIGKNVEIMEYAIVRKDVVLGDDVVIHPFAVLEEGVIIGKGVEVFPHAYIGKKPKGPGLANKPKYEKYAKVGDYSVIGPNAIICYGTIIGDNSMVSDGVSIRENCKIGNGSIIGRNVTINFGTIIGDHSRVMDLSHITARAVIEDNVFIGPGVSSADDDSMGRGSNYNPEEDKGAHIKQGVSIGEACVILPKIEIGEGSIVGAGTVLRKKVKAGTLVIGNQELLKTKL